MKWNFFSIGHADFDVRSIDLRPLGGTESSLIYLMKTLAKKGEEVWFFRPNTENLNIDSIIQRELKNFDELYSNNPDVIIFVGNLNKIKDFEVKNKKTPFILWIHHAANQRDIDQLQYENFCKKISSLVFISEWQKNGFIKKFRIEKIKKFTVGYGISFEFQDLFKSFDDFKNFKKKNLGIYTSVPFRGLEVLIESEKFLLEKDIKIEIFSGMKTYMQSDEPYYEFYKKIENSNIFINMKPQKKKILSISHINKSFLFYPCIFAEAFCSSVVDALAAGCEVVTTKFGCFNEVYGDHLTFMKIDNLKKMNDFAKKFALLMDERMNFKKNNFETWCKKRFEQITQIKNVFDWNKKADTWVNIVKNL